MIFGLTGGICSGKSTASKIFEKQGVQVFDADIVAKTIMDNSEIIEEISKSFGRDILDEDNKINRNKLREIVFNNNELRIKLNNIVHPKVRKYFLNIKETTPSEEIVIFDVPLLFEGGMDKICDKTIVILCDDEIKLNRLISKRNMPFDIAKKIIEAQMPDEEKREKADYFIENNGSLETFKKKVLALYKEIFI